MNIYIQDKKLADSVSLGDKYAWNNFVKKYSDYILSNILNWCKTSCKKISQTEVCAVENLVYKKDSSKSENVCEEGLELYVYIFNSLKNKLSKYQGKSSLKTYITACLRFIYSDFFISKYGKINIPTALKDSSETDKKVYKILCKSSNLDNAIEKLETLNISKEDTIKSFNNILNLLKNDGKEKAWHHLYSQFSKNSRPEYFTNLNSQEEEIEKDVAIYDKDFQDKEVLEIFEKSFNKLESKYQRLIKLKFKNNLSVNEIFKKYSEIFEFKKEQDVYTELEKAVKSLALKIKEYYSENKSIVDLKEFKDILYDIFSLVES